jgi:hypothetical protein
MSSPVLSAQARYETRDYQVTLALIEAGLGISLVPASVLGHASRAGIAFRPVEGMSLARAIHLVHRKRPTALVTDITTVITNLNPDTAAVRRPGLSVWPSGRRASAQEDACGGSDVISADSVLAGYGPATAPA